MTIFVELFLGCFFLISRSLGLICRFLAKEFTIKLIKLTQLWRQTFINTPTLIVDSIPVNNFQTFQQV
ncbi:hypothetical protein DERP_005101 [Dermatophagoides pteronyssinus]|uniref:Uncharacterized protein n=1 Tax=Dermatophagoides pteronyssinus TaxID=6956 RepID=A0ABQ8JTI7_DERPT|nr:hypothetical protein DERP_005101 [Dermatophagoides pteronyssinus]